MVTGVMETVHMEVSDCYQALKFPCPDTIDDLMYPSMGFWLEEEGHRDRLFQTKAIVRDRACALTINYKNPFNTASLEMVACKKFRTYVGLGYN
jgi:hypothetical protein